MSIQVGGRRRFWRTFFLRLLLLLLVGCRDCEAQNAITTEAPVVVDPTTAPVEATEPPVAATEPPVAATEPPVAATEPPIVEIPTTAPPTTAVVATTPPDGGTTTTEAPVATTDAPGPGAESVAPLDPTTAPTTVFVGPTSPPNVTTEPPIEGPTVGATAGSITSSPTPPLNGTLEPSGSTSAPTIIDGNITSAPTTGENTTTGGPTILPGNGTLGPTLFPGENETVTVPPANGTEPGNGTVSPTSNIFFPPTSPSPNATNATSAPTVNDTAVPIAPNATTAPNGTNTPEPTMTTDPTDEMTTSPPPSKFYSPTKPPAGSPTRKPETQPPDPATKVSQDFIGIKLTFGNVGSLKLEQQISWANVTKVWYELYFRSPLGSSSSSSSRTRRLGGRRRTRGRRLAEDVRGLTTLLEIRGQTISETNPPSNTLTYNQRVTYYAGPNAPSTESLILEPFLDATANGLYSSMLKKSDPEAFGDMTEPVATPVVPSSGGGGDKGGLSVGAIVGIAVAGVVVIALAALGGYWFFSRKDIDDDHDPYDQGSAPPAAFQVTTSEDISTLDAPTQGVGSGGADTGMAEYGDQSVATVDYDYSKAYGGAGDQPSVSSAGGTLGDNTRQTADVAAGNAARAALGASSFDSDAPYQPTDPNVKEEIIEINAPSGKLGVVIDTPDDGAPVVHAVKDSSVIADQIQVGDKLVAVDDEDVRSMTAIKVSKLISKKSANPSRKLTVIRATIIEDPVVADPIDVHGHGGHRA